MNWNSKLAQEHKYYYYKDNEHATIKFNVIKTVHNHDNWTISRRQSTLIDGCSRHVNTERSICANCGAEKPSQPAKDG